MTDNTHGQVPADTNTASGAAEPGAMQAATLSAYAPADQAFYKFWYGHMLADLMQPPLVGMSHTTARYIWDAALASTPAQPAPAAVAGSSEFPHEKMDAVALGRYKVVSSDQSMFYRFAVVAGDGAQQLYIGREVDCQNMARKFAGAFLDGAFAYHSMTAAPTTQPAPNEDEGISREQWIEQAMRVYLIAGDTEQQAEECAKYLWGELDMDDLADPYDAAMSDVEGRGPAPQQEAQEPFAWHVCSVNSDGSLSLEHAAAWEEAAHEHINDATTEHDIEGAGSWVVRPAYHAPQPSPAAQGDAARLDFLIEHQAYVVSDDTCCGGYWLRFPVDGGTTSVQIGEYETPRAAIDAARAAQEGE